MGCATSKGTSSPELRTSASRKDHKKRSAPITPCSVQCRNAHDKGNNVCEDRKETEEVVVVDEVVVEEDHHHELKESEKESTDSANLQKVRLGNLHNYIEGEQVAAGWPSWLTTFAGEAIKGWVPLKAGSFEKLEMIGQGTYSSVFRARKLETGKVVALKKVRFDNFDPESIRFMAREIKILRRLDHPNVMKLEGLITSPLSRSLYLVFEYMEHDLAGLSSSTEIKFTQSQVKCYLRQLLSGIEHCHSFGIMHRDIKGANLLVDNEGVLKIADFGLANFCIPDNKQPLTSRVVTLWYRPPELLLGSTEYESTIDLWSVGCVFAEMFVGRPILQGRTEVEQLHKIFRLCGSPPDEYWKNTKLTHSTIFRPHQPYESSLKDTFKHLPPSAAGLLQTFLSVEPSKRGTASSALASEYFRTKPYACDPSSIPKYAPTKEIDVKNHDDSHRRLSGRGQKSRRSLREPFQLSKIADSKEESQTRADQVKKDYPKVDGENRLYADLPPMPATKHPDEGHYTKYNPPRNHALSGPMHVPTSSTGFGWTKGQKEDHAYGRPLMRPSSKGSLPSARDKTSGEFKGHENRVGHNLYSGTKGGGQESLEMTKRAMVQNWVQLEHPESFNVYHSQDFSENLYAGVTEKDRVEFSGPLLAQSHKVDEHLQKNEHHIRHAVRRSWLQKVSEKNPGK